MTPDRPSWDESRARAMIGSHILIGLTRSGPEGETHEQMYGTIKSADASQGFEIELHGSLSGQFYWLPPHIDAFHAAEPGEYRLKSTGQTVVNPDYLSTWTIEKPAEDST